MKHCIISQFQNESCRLAEWLDYHSSQGIDSFILFDDFSTDKSLLIIEEFKILNSNINIQVFKTDENIKNDYSKYIKRQIRSMNAGLDMARNINPNCYCYIIDVDEFINGFPLNEKITNLVEKSMSRTGHLYIQSFDVDDSFNLNIPLLKQSNTMFRWADDVRRKSIYKDRGKSIIIANKINKIQNNDGFIHYLFTNDGVIPPESRVTPERLRIHHFRLNSGLKQFNLFDDSLHKRYENR